MFDFILSLVVGYAVLGAIAVLVVAHCNPRAMPSSAKDFVLTALSWPRLVWEWYNKDR